MQVGPGVNLTNIDLGIVNPRCNISVTVVLSTKFSSIKLRNVYESGYRFIMTTLTNLL